jgi:hypothetical protein
MPNSLHSSPTRLHVRNRSNAIARNDSVLRPPGFLAIAVSIPCKYAHFRLSHFWGSLHPWGDPLSCAGWPILCRSGTLLLQNSTGGFRQAGRCLAYAWDWSRIWMGGALIRGISIACRLRAGSRFRLSPGQSGDGTISLPTHYRLANVPSVIGCPCHLAWDSLRPVSSGVFQVVKTAQSRGRTERTLLTRDLCSPQAPSRGAGMLRTGVIHRF